MNTSQMTPSQTEQLNRIVRRWAQAHRKQDLLDWRSQTGMLIDMANSASRIASSEEDHQFAADLYALAWLSYYRSFEFMPQDFSQPSYLMSAAA